MDIKMPKSKQANNQKIQDPEKMNMELYFGYRLLIKTQKRKFIKSIVTFNWHEIGFNQSMHENVCLQAQSVSL